MLNEREHAATPRRGRGFSLLELVLVLVVMATLAGIALPRMSASTNTARVEQAVDRVEALIAEARSLARARSGPVTLEFDSAAETVRLVGGSKTSAFRLSDSPYHARIETVSLKAGAIMTIDGMGVADSWGTITLRAGTAERTLTIDAPAAGAAKVPIVFK